MAMAKDDDDDDDDGNFKSSWFDMGTLPGADQTGKYADQ